MRRRLAPLVTLLLLAPVFAEYSSGYLASAGDPAVMAGELLVLIPLYGGAALSIRELAVRRGLGWRGVLLLAGAFGIVQAGIVDRSIFTLTGTDIAFWPGIMAPTWVDAWGVSVGAALGWTLGHVITSIGAPIAVVEALWPGVRGRPLVGRVGLSVTLVLWLAVSVLVHVEVGGTYRPVPSPGQYLAVALLGLTLVLAALRAPECTQVCGEGRIWLPSLALPAALGAVAVVAADLASTGWAATAACLLVTVAVWSLLVRLARRLRWGSVHVGAVALGAMLARAIEAFGTPPATDVSDERMLAHTAGFLVLILGLIGALVIATRARAARA